MSWALEEWKEGLPTRALQKIQELEGQLDKLKKEKQHRQFQLESLGIRTAEAEAEGINHFLKQFAVFGLVHFLVKKRSCYLQVITIFPSEVLDCLWFLHLWLYCYPPADI